MGNALQSEAALRRPDEYDSPDDASGTKQWIVQIGTTLWDYLTGVAVDSLENAAGCYDGV